MKICSLSFSKHSYILFCSSFLFVLNPFTGLINLMDNYVLKCSFCAEISPLSVPPPHLTPTPAGIREARKKEKQERCMCWNFELLAVSLKIRNTKKTYRHTCQHCTLFIFRTGGATQRPTPGENKLCTVRVHMSIRLFIVPEYLRRSSKYICPKPNTQNYSRQKKKKNYKVKLLPTLRHALLNFRWGYPLLRPLFPFWGREWVDVGRAWVITIDGHNSYWSLLYIPFSRARYQDPLLQGI